MTPSPGLRTLPSAGALLALPGLRTLLDARFRMVVATVLLAIGTSLLGLALVRSATGVDGQTAIDFAAYHGAAQAMADGRSPYQAEMLEGPVPAQGRDAYRYPPTFAQLLMPLALLPLPLAAAAWFIAQAAAVLAAVWLAGSAGGARPSLERANWTGVAAVWFLPVFDSLWKGNVSGWLALATTLMLVGGASAGVATALLTLIKLTPAALLVPAVAGRTGVPRRGRLLIGAIATAVGVGAVSVLLAPAAWMDFARALPNLTAGSADYLTNLAPATVISMRVAVPAELVTLGHLATLGLAAALIAASIVLARRQGGWPAAVTSATAGSLLVPSAVWYHYLCVLLPLAAFAWPRATTMGRIGLVAGSALVFAGFGWWLPLALAGATVLVIATLVTLWPSPTAAAGTFAGARTSGAAS